MGINELFDMNGYRSLYGASKFSSELFILEFGKYKIDVVVIELLDKKIKKMEMWNQSVDMVLKSDIYDLLVKI